MIIYSTGLDANDRSTHGEIDIPLRKISETEAVSAKQPGTYWYYTMRSNVSKLPQTDPGYDPPGGPYEQHPGGLPHMPVLLTGMWDTILQDGTTMRFAPGDIHLTRAGAMHQTNIHSLGPMSMIVIYLPGGADGVRDYSAERNFAPLVMTP